MRMESEMEVVDKDSLTNRPGILMVGSSNVGKRTLLSRLLSIDFEDASDSSSEVLCYGWNINTKYYTADVSIWMAHLDDGFSIGSLPIVNNLAAIVMVFDLNDLASFTALQDWVSHTELKRFDILLCIGNKADLLSGHFAHAEYRRRMQRHGERASDPHPEFLDYGILETEGSSLLGDEEPSWAIRRSCLEWCTQYNIEYVEACASNAAFDKCLSVDGDSQGVERLYGALSAHMWPGMILKSGDQISQPYPAEKEESSDEEPDYEFEYEILSRGSAEPWDDTEEVWVSADGTTSDSGTGKQVMEVATVSDHNQDNAMRSDADEAGPSSSVTTVQEQSVQELSERDVEKASETNELTELDEDKHLAFEDVEQLMNEIGNIRGSLRLMPDFQRREMAAKLAMKMASMFGDNSGDEEDFI